MDNHQIENPGGPGLNRISGKKVTASIFAKNGSESRTLLPESKNVPEFRDMSTIPGN